MPDTGSDWLLLIPDSAEFCDGENIAFLSDGQECCEVAAPTCFHDEIKVLIHVGELPVPAGYSAADLLNAEWC